MAEQAEVDKECACLPCETVSVPQARALLSAAFARWALSEEVAESARLIVSELVTNAVRAGNHTDRGVRVAFTLDAARGVLRIEVSDAGGGEPHVRSPESDETCGRGLLLVDALAQEWGVQQDDRGKTVWAELKAPVV
ncbi:ATP-binding protein [Yinghuangia sp. YIM S10712]|uniref:ATP-binding protein n=1 Tax=Yinghuangia sp. YIM S10712 TaxID=3436930 RepID=UPI003F532B12